MGDKVKKTSFPEFQIPKTMLREHIRGAIRPTSDAVIMGRKNTQLFHRTKI